MSQKWQCSSSKPQLKRPCRFLLSLLDIYHSQVNKPRLACLVTRPNHSQLTGRYQTPDTWMTPSVVAWWYPPPTPKIYPCSNPCNLWLLPYAVRELIKLKVLKEGTQPGLSGWALNGIMCNIIIERQKEFWDGCPEEKTQRRGRGNVMTQAESRVM